MPRVAITGASGLLGTHLLPLLNEQGYDVRALVHSTPLFAGMKHDPVHGDVQNPDAVRRCLDGCDFVIHLASSFRPDDDVARIISYGTKNVITSSQDAGVKRLLFVSCMGADAAAHATFYSAKWEAEMAVRAAQIPFVVLRPSLILGRGDGVIRPLVDVIRSFPVVPVPGAGEQRAQPIDAADMARCLIQALSEESLTNETVDVGGPMFLTFRQLVDLVSGQIGVARPKLLVPSSWMRVVTGALPTLRTLYSPVRVAQFQRGVVTSPGVVEARFGFAPSSVTRRLGAYLA